MIRKLGLVLECDAQGPDELVLKCLTRRLAPNIQVFTRPLGNKMRLFQQGVQVAEGLVEIDRCDLVLIVWDLKPFWRDPKCRNCREEVALLKMDIFKLKVKDRSKVKLLCITYELESWLVVDERAINDYFESKSHARKYRSAKWDKVKEPKDHLDKNFKSLSLKSSGYEDYIDAIEICRRIPDLKRIGRVDSFKRFKDLVSGAKLQDFQISGDCCRDLTHQAYQRGK